MDLDFMVTVHLRISTFLLFQHTLWDKKREGGEALARADRIWYDTDAFHHFSLSIAGQGTVAF